MSTASECKIRDHPSMLIFGVYEGERVGIEVPMGSTVGEVKKMIQVKLNIFIDDLVKQDKQVLVLSFAGSDLNDNWIFTDLGIIPGSTCKVCMREEVKPVLFVKCSHDGEVIEIMDNYFVERMLVEDLRTIVSKRSGLPVCIFRLVSRTNLELFDDHDLFYYDIECGDTVFMECWDGWAELINYSILGLTPSVLPLIVSDEIQQRFQLKVVMYIAAHFGCVDLARTCIKFGIRPDEPIGEHPSRQWCQDQSHIETKRAAVHEAAEFGQLGVLRLFVTNDLTCSMAKEGHNLTPLSLSLRNRQRPCASFLLAKQWIRVPITRTESMTLQTVRRIKLWCERCKEKAFMRYGPSKSSLKRRTFNTGPLVSHGVIIDGFSPSQMNGKPKIHPSNKERRKQANEENNASETEDPESYFRHLTALHTYSPKFKLNTRWSKMISKFSISGAVIAGLKSHLKGDRSDDPDGTDFFDNNPQEANLVHTTGRDSVTKLPHIDDKTRYNLIMSQSRTSIYQDIPEEQEESSGTVEKHIVSAEKGRKHFRTGMSRSKGEVNQTSPNAKTRSVSVDKREKNVANSSSETTYKAYERANSVISPANNKKKITSAMLIQHGNRSRAEGAVPLPVISNEHDLRPFFYHNGVRESDILNPLMRLVSRHQGTDARDRAVKSLAIANSFKDKPWLVQVQMAMSLTSSTLKREVTNLRHSFHEVSRHDRRMSKVANTIN